MASFKGNLSHHMTKPKQWPVHPARTQISLGTHPIWSESLLCPFWVAKVPMLLHVGSKDSDQTGRMPRLIWVFAGHTDHFVGFVMLWLSYVFVLRGWLCLKKPCAFNCVLKIKPSQTGIVSKGCLEIKPFRNHQLPVVHLFIFFFFCKFSSLWYTRIIDILSFVLENFFQQRLSQYFAVLLVEIWKKYMKQPCFFDSYKSWCLACALVNVCLTLHASCNFWTMHARVLKFQI